jgi:hypothetical protein
MKYIKMLGLAAVAAAALMAFMGAGTASAAKTLTSTGVKLNAPVSIHAVLTDGVKSPAVLSTTDGKTIVDECEESTVQGATTNSDTPITGHISVLSWGKCDVTTDTLTNGDLTIDENGTVTGAGSVVTVNTGVTCRYGTGAGTHLGTLTTGVLNINAVINEQEPKAFLCPDTTKWVASYTVTTPHDLSLG